MKLLASKSAAVKILASAALVGGAASVAGLGTFGAFTSTTTANQSVATGKVVLSTTSGPQDFGLAVSNMVPGDTIQRTVTLTRSSDTEAFGAIKLTSTSDTSNLLTTDATNGLQVKVEECPTAWVKAANTNDLTCSGQVDTVVTQRAVLAGTGSDLAKVTSSLNGAGKTSNLKVTLTLPTDAGNAFQGLSTNLKFTFDATQRAAKAL
ncbi:TasA family protein [Nocardioides sp. SR21]|uniref:TasA family protein n=1 Tax=Nocardioides sp. SR21 TaxID=2919501 RepID=UPI001FAA195F|nr:TasA family protein [Nocardioides sp. SR21]